jgi:hypothetical protein
MLGSRDARMTRMRWAFIVLAVAAPARAQGDPARADAYLPKATELCAKDGGRLWGQSLCGPIVVADATTRTVATSQPAPDAPRPPALGFANAAMMWGGVRWATIVWQLIPPDPHLRGRLLLHELFHRIQPELGFTQRDSQNDHLDTVDGRYWMQLEWRALATALEASGPARDSAARDALAFRAQRRVTVPAAAENERLLEMNEGLAQYTGTLLSADSVADATDDAIEQLAQAALAPTFVRTFAYASGAAYGLLLDAWSPGWPRRLKATDDLAALLVAASGLAPTADAARAALAYDGVALKTAEDKREVERQARVAEFRRIFIERPVLVIPNGRSNSFATAGLTPIPGVGTIVPGFRTTGEWGTLEAATVLLSANRTMLTVPAPGSIDGTMLRGDGWTLTLAAGWVVRPGARAGDFQVVRE